LVSAFWQGLFGGVNNLGRILNMFCSPADTSTLRTNPCATTGNQPTGGAPKGLGEKALLSFYNQLISKCL
jgi:hypothetical protein